MEETNKNKVLKLLKGNIILSIDVKERVVNEISNISDQQVEKLLFILKKLREKQEEILKAKLKEEPWLFTKLEIVASNGIHSEHVKIEKNELEGIEENLIQELNNL